LADKITEEQAYQYASSPADLKLMFTVSTEYEKKFHSDTMNEAPELKND
jgi:twitching motility protein PilT